MRALCVMGDQEVILEPLFDRGSSCNSSRWPHRSVAPETADQTPTRCRLDPGLAAVVLRQRLHLAGSTPKWAHYGFRR